VARVQPNGDITNTPIPEKNIKNATRNLNLIRINLNDASHNVPLRRREFKIPLGIEIWRGLGPPTSWRVTTHKEVSNRAKALINQFFCFSFLKLIAIFN
jgi:hypothetical protein